MTGLIRNMFRCSAFFLLAVIACSPPEAPRIGNGVSGPFSLVSASDNKTFYVLNSSPTAEFQDGSLSRYEIDTAGKLTHKVSASIPRMGLNMALSADGKFIVVSFAGTDAALRFYDISGETITERNDLYFSNGQFLDTPVFFTPAGAQAGEYFLLVNENRYSDGAKAVVLKVSGTKTEQILSLPDDLPGKKPDGYTLAFNAPSYISTSGLLVAFPHNTGGDVLPSDSAYKVATGNWTDTSESVDLRAGSMVIVDFEKFLSAKSLANAIAFIPFIHNDDYQLADPSKLESEEPNNKHLVYRQHFHRSYYVNQNGCYDRNPGQKVASDTVLLVERSVIGDRVIDGQILSLGNWAEVKARMAELPESATENYDYKTKVMYRTTSDTRYVTTALYSSSEKQDINPSRVLRFSTMESAGKCFPVWTRVVAGKALGGLEQSYLQTNGDADKAPTEPISTDAIARGTVSVTSQSNLAITGSFSLNVIQVNKLENLVFSKVE